MKKYKLIKKYPSLPKTSKEGMIVEYYDVIEGYSDHNLGAYSTVELDKEEVEDNPEYWEEIILPKYKIISFTDGSNVYFKQENGFFTINTRHCYSCEALLNRDNVKIHKVVRISDGEIFCLGDKVRHQNLLIPAAEIDKFYINKDNECLIHSKNAEFSEVIDRVELNNPLFSTVDGKDIYKFDKFYVVGKFFNIQETHGGHFQNDKWEKFRFATREKAQEYAINNKPCLSMMDFQKAFLAIGYCNADQGDRICDLAHELKNIVKEKL